MLRRRLELSAQRYGMGRSFRIASVSKRDIAAFLGKDAAKGAGGTRASVEKDVPGRVWVWEDELDGQRERKEEKKLDAKQRGNDEKPNQQPTEEGKKGKGGERRGVWVQRATFHSTFTLTCPPTFAIESIQCQVSTTFFHPLSCTMADGENTVVLPYSQSAIPWCRQQYTSPCPCHGHFGHRQTTSKGQCRRIAERGCRTNRIGLASVRLSDSFETSKADRQ